MKNAIVLSGGGSKGAFEAGACLYLYDSGIRPEILCSTSAGSLNSIKLAENGRNTGRELVDIWFALRTNDDMYKFQDWFDQLDDDLKGVAIEAVLGVGGIGVGLGVGGTLAVGALGLGGLLVAAPFALIAVAIAGSALEGSIEEQLKQLVEKILKEKSVMRLDPVRARLGAVAQGWNEKEFPLQGAGILFSRKVFCDILGRLHIVGVLPSGVVEVYMQSRPGGTNWSLLGRIHERGVDFNRVAVELDRNFRPLIFVTSTSGRETIVYRHRGNLGFAEIDRFSRMGNPAGPPALVRDRDGNVIAFVKGGNDSIHYRTQTAADELFEPWQSLDTPGRRPVSNPQVVMDAAGDLHVFVMAEKQGAASTEGLFVIHRRGDEWGEWKEVPLPPGTDSVHFVGPYTPVMNAAGGIDLFLGQVAGQVEILDSLGEPTGQFSKLHKIFRSRLGISFDAWTPWSEITIPGHSPAQHFTPIMNADGRMEIFFTNEWDKVLHRFELEPMGEWSSISTMRVGNPYSDVYQGLSAVKNKDGRLEVFVEARPNVFRTPDNPNPPGYKLRHIWHTTPSAVDVEKILRAGTTLRMAVVGLESGQVSYISERGTISGSVEYPRSSPFVSPVNGAIASASIPVVFPPVHIGGENFVDGGIQENFPVNAAIKLGAEKIFAVTVTPSPWKEGSFNDKGILDIASRTVNLMLQEITNNDLTAPPNWTGELTVIRPNLPLSDALEVDPVYIRNAADYGYMCAHDELFISQELKLATSDLQRGLVLLKYVMLVESANQIYTIRLQLQEKEKMIFVALFNILLLTALAEAASDPNNSNSTVPLPRVSEEDMRNLVEGTRDMFREVRALKRDLRTYVNARQTYATNSRPNAPMAATLHLRWENLFMIDSLSNQEAFSFGPWDAISFGLFSIESETP